MAGIHFDITADNRNFVDAITQIQKSVNQTSNVLNRIGKDFNVNGLTNQIAALSKVIQENEALLIKSKEQITKWMDEAIKARDLGDTSLFKAINRDIEQETKNMQDLANETKEYKDALSEIKTLNGFGSSEKPSKLFSTQDSFEEYERLLEKREDLQSKIANFDTEGLSDRQVTQRLVEMRSEITVLNTDINNMELAAAKAAAELGKNGDKAAEASTKYYILTKAVDEQLVKINALQNKLNEAKDAFVSAVNNNDTEGAEIAQALYDELKATLHDADMELVALQKDQQEAKQVFEQFGDTTTSLRTRLMTVTRELGTLTLQYRQMSAEEKSSAQGRELQNKIKQLTKEAGELRDTMDDVTEAIRSSASDTRAFDSIAGGINVVTSAFGAATGVAAMFGVEEKDLLDIQAKLQASLAISNALTVIQNQLQKESALMIGISNIQRFASAKAIDLENAAKGRGTIATIALTAAQKAFNAVAAMNPYVLLATAIISVVGGIYLLTKAFKSNSEEEEIAKQKAEELREEQNRLFADYTKNVGKLKTSYMELQTQWNSLSNDQERSKWITENKDKFEALGIKVNNVKDAEEVLVNNTSAVIRSMMLRAKASYQAAQAQAAYERALNGKIDENTRTVNTEQARWMSNKGYKVTQTGDNKWFAEAEGIKAYNSALESMADQVFQNAQYGIVDLQNEANNLLGEFKKGAKDEKNSQNNSNKKSLNEIQAKEEQERKEQARRTAEAVAKAKIAAEHNAAEKARLEIELEYEKDKRNLEALEESYRKKNVELIKDRYESQHEGSYYDTDEYKNYLQNQFKNVELTTDQQEELDNKLIVIEENKKEKLRQSYMDELQAYKDYVSEYGSIAQQQFAITQYYAEKQKDAKNEWEKMTLAKQEARDKEMLNVNAITKGLDWKAIMQGVGSIAKDMMKPMLQQLEAYAQSEGFRKNLDGTQQQAITSLINELRQYVSVDSKEMQSLTKAMLDFNQSVAEYDSAEKAEQAKRAELDKAIAENREDDAKRLKDELDSLGEKTAQARDRMITFSNGVNTAADRIKNMAGKLTVVLNGLETWQNVREIDELKQSSKSLDEVANNTNAAYQKSLKEDVEEAIKNATKNAQKQALDTQLELGTITQEQYNKQLTEAFGSSTTKLLGGMANVLSSFSGGMGNVLQSVLGQGLGQIVGVVAQIPRLILDIVGAIKNFVTGVLDSLSELLSFSWLEDLVNSILDAVGNLINAIFDLPENLFHVLESIVVNGVGGLINSVIGRVGNILSFGLLDSGGPAEWFNGSNAEEVEEAINNLTDRNTKLQRSIEDLTTAMDKARGADAVKLTNEAMKLQEETNKNLLEMAKEQASYHGDHHSWNYYWEDGVIPDEVANSWKSLFIGSGFTESDVKRVNEQLKIQGLEEWNGSIWDMSPEQMKVLRSNIDLWQKIIDAGESYYGEAVAEKLDAYIDQAGKLEEFRQKLYENLTTTTKDNIFEDFLNDLYNFADGSEDVMEDIADNWQKMVNKMAINNIVGQKFQKDLNDWYDKLGELNEQMSLGDISQRDYQDRLNALYEEYTQMFNKAQSDVQQLVDMGIVNATGENAGKEDKKATYTTAEKVTYDQMDEFTGILRAIQIADEHGSVTRDLILEHIQMMSMMSTQSGSDIREIRNMLGTTNDYLLDIRKSNRSILDNMTEKMDTIIDKIENLDI